MPPPLSKKQAAKPDTQMRFRVDGVTYLVDRNEFTPAIERELFSQAGVTPQQAAQALGGGAFFGLVAMVFLAKRQAGETAVYQQLEDRLWKARQAAGDDFDVTVLDDDDGEGEVGPPS